MTNTWRYKKETRPTRFIDKRTKTMKLNAGCIELTKKNLSSLNWSEVVLLGTTLLLYCLKK